MFPHAETRQAWAALRADDAALRSGVEAISARHRLGGEPIRRYSTGTLPVYAIGTRYVLKLFPPPDSDGALTEEQALAAVEGRLPIPTPRMLASGETDGLATHWLEQIPEFLHAWMPAADGRRALLHTELMREHLLVAPRKNRWQLTGLFDFEPAMVGVAEYDLASCGLFVSAGDPRLFGRTLCAYGRSDAIGNDVFARRILAYTLLHRYSNLRWYLERMPPEPDQRSLESLAQRWFGATSDE
jgi:hypothetical protein